MAFNISDDDILWLKGSHVGWTWKLDDSFNVQKELHAVGIFSINVFPMGGQMVLLTADEGVDLVQVFREFEEVFKRLFFGS